MTSLITFIVRVSGWLNFKIYRSLYILCCSLINLFILRLFKIAKSMLMIASKIQINKIRIRIMLAWPNSRYIFLSVNALSSELIISK